MSVSEFFEYGMTGYTFTPYTSECQIDLPVDISLNVYDIIFDLNIELEYVVSVGSKIGLRYEIYNFNNETISGDIYKEGDPLTGLVKLKFTDLLYTNITEQLIKMKFLFDNTNYTSGQVSVKKFNYIIRDTLSKKYYTLFKDPEYLYSYNSSINGLIDNQEKNGIHIFLNEKFKNILIVINENIPINIDFKSINNIDLFGENYGLYYGKTFDSYYSLFSTNDSISHKKYNPNDIIASNYIKSINNLNEIISLDTNIYYHYIDKDGNYASTQMTYFNNSTFDKLPNWINKFPPFLLRTEVSETLFLYEKNYNVQIHPGPSKNIRDKYIVYDNGNPVNDRIKNELLGTKIETNPSSKKNNYKYKINRYSGFYEPVTTNIPLFKPVYYWNDDGDIKSFSGNYKFNTNVSNFATINEMMYSKVNENEYVLKLKNVSELSLYPILDEVGLSQTSRNIFSSPWDSDYYLRTINEIVLFDNTYTKEKEDVVVSTLSQLVNVDIVSGISNYYKGINIYGKTYTENNLMSLGLTNAKIGLDFSIINLSSNNNNFDYVIKYQSAQKTYVITSGKSQIINVKEEQKISIQLDRPNEIIETINYEEFTKWNLIIEIYESGTNNLLDYDNNISFNVYNNIIEFVLSNYDTFRQVYYVGVKYDFTLTLSEIYNKLKNVKYNLDVKLENGVNTGVYNTISSVSDLINKTSNTLDLVFNCEIPIDIDYNTNQDRRIRYEVYHTYIIEGVVKKIFTYYTNTIKISRTQEVPKLSWLNYPTINISQGICTTEGTYSGDSIFTGVKLTNLGGRFVGTVKVIFTLRENGVAIFSKSISKDLFLDKGISTTEFENVTLGPLNINGQPIVTYTDRNYDIKVSTSYISGSYRSEIISGLNDTTPDCSIK